MRGEAAKDRREEGVEHGREKCHGTQPVHEGHARRGGRIRRGVHASNPTDFPTDCAKAASQAGRTRANPYTTYCTPPGLAKHLLPPRSVRRVPSRLIPLRVLPFFTLASLLAPHLILDKYLVYADGRVRRSRPVCREELVLGEREGGEERMRQEKEG